MWPDGELPPTGDRLVRRSSGEDAARYIRRLIFDGRLKPGERVPQDEVARALGISRIPVREGLIALERDGWVTIELHRGAFVTPLDEQAVRDHYELYGTVYGFAVQRAIERSPDGLAEKLDELARALGRTDEPGEVHALVLEFHDAVLTAARSPRLRHILRALATLVPGNFFDVVPAAADVVRRGLVGVVRAVKRGDGSRAAEEYQRMMRRQGDLVVTVFRERGVLQEPPAVS
jgi:DNA-binding GntR family transcriptional regulator